MAVASAAEAAALAFENRGWQWTTGGAEESEVPSVARIAACLAGMVSSVGSPGGPIATRTGRFVVERCEEDGDEWIEITLKLASIDVEDAG